METDFVRREVMVVWLKTERVPQREARSMTEGLETW